VSPHPPLDYTTLFCASGVISTVVLGECHHLLEEASPYLDRCASSSISIISSGRARPLTSSQLPVGNCFV